MTIQLRRFLLPALAVLLVLPWFPEESSAANYFSSSSGSWTGNNRWRTGGGAACGLAGNSGAGYPGSGANDVATICNTNAITLDVSPANAVSTLTINNGGTLNMSSFTLGINNSPAITLGATGAFNAQTGTVTIARDNTTSVVAGTAASITFNNLTFMQGVSIGGSRIYTLGAAGSSITSMTIGGDFLANPTGAGGGAARVLTINAGTVTTLSVTGTTTLAMQGNNDSTILNSPATFSSGKVILGGGGSSGTDTLAPAALSAVTIGTNQTSGTLFIRNANGVFTASTSTVTMSPSDSVTLNSGTFTAANAFNNLTVTMPATRIGTLGNDIAANGTLLVTAGTLDNGGFAITSDGASTFQVNNGATFQMSGTAAFPPTSGGTHFSTYTFQPTSTERYLQSNAQDVSPQTYGHLEVSPSANSITHTFAAGTTTVAGNLTIGNGTNTGVIVTGATNDPTLDVDGNVAISANTELRGPGTNPFTVAGDWTNNGTYTHNSGTVTFDGTLTQTLGGSSPTPTFDKLTVNKASNSLTIGTSPTVNTTLTLTSGNIVTGSNKLTLAAAGTVSGVPGVATAASTHHVLGNFEKVFDGSNLSFTYPLGDGANYTPVRVVFNSLSAAGNLTATTPAATAADHPDTTGSRTGVNSASSVNRYWTLKNSTAAGTYDVTLFYLAGDLDSGAPTHVARGAACATSGGVRTCNPWGRYSGSVSGNSIATSSGLLVVTGDPDADLVTGQSATPRFTRQKEFIYTRELY
jgi:hypothetical protein